MTVEGQRSRPTVSSFFVVAILSGSFLLFLVQPMIARMALPRLGGAPAVWGSAMLLYQTLLLGGYAYAHWLRRFSARRQAAIHVVLLVAAALWLPIGLTDAQAPAGGEPALWVPWLLLTSIGPLFLAIAAQAPLLQRWFVASASDVNPYPLYAASNLGSFGGLIAYPLLVEPNLTLSSQSWLWSAGYGLILLLVLGCALGLPSVEPGRASATRVPRPAARRIAHWIALACVPSGLMLATSTFLTTDIVAVPLLWVIPLGLYLLSYSIAFATGRRVADLLTSFAPVTILVFGGVMIGGVQEATLLNAVVPLALLFMVSVALHTQLYRLRPPPERLTDFYLAIAAGGALGGVFAGLAAPMMFDWTYEYPVLIFAAGLLAPQSWLLPLLAPLWTARRGVMVAGAALLVAAILMVGLFDPGQRLGERHERFAFLALAGLGVLTVGARPVFLIFLASALYLFGGHRTILTTLEGDKRARSYFGIYTIADRPLSGTRTLTHGTTLHGVQIVGDPARAREPTSYYVRASGVGQAMAALPALYGPRARVGVVGLGTGTLACYATPEQDWLFYEIDPLVVRIARDTGQFSFLSQCLPQARIVLGDARLSIAAQPRDSLDLLVLDAFSSDAVPMHLMTGEAFEIYGRVLGHRGLLLVHVSNRFLDLEPVVAATAGGQGWYAAVLHHAPGRDNRNEASNSDWIALTHDPAVRAELLAGEGDWEPLRDHPGVTAWTDDYSSILPVLKHRFAREKP